MGKALLVEYYEELPEPRGEDARAWESRLRHALERFRRKVVGRYAEGTLHRLLHASDGRTRRATIVALGLTGTLPNSNAVVAGLLHDDDSDIRQLAAEALWSMWFRGGTDRQNRELQRLVNLRDLRKKRNGLDALIEKAPDFAEAYNQRAIVHFQMEDWHRSIADCERTLELNSYHFGAAAGMARCYMELGKHRAALKAFRTAYRVNPGLEEVKQAIRALENALGEEGKK